MALSCKELLAAFARYNGRLTQTTDPELLAGGYLKWAGGDLKHAIETLKLHDGRFIDRPDFTGRTKALALLEAAAFQPGGWKYEEVLRTE